MKTLKLKEWSQQTVRLTQIEVSRLVSVPKILSLTPVAPQDGIYKVSANSIVGTIVWPELRVLIRPKVDLQNVFFLLGFRGGLAKWRTAAFPYATEWDFHESIAWVFSAEMKSGLRYGINRAYEEKVETLRGLRGRLDIARQMARSQDQPYPTECRFTEYSEDNALNRVLKAANTRLLKVGGLEQDLVRSLRNVASELATVCDENYAPMRIPDVVFTRLNAHWEAAFNLARLILRGETLLDETGAAVGTGFTVDMNSLFEKFLEEIVAREAWRVGLELEPQRQVILTDNVKMYPDLTVTKDGRPLAVADAKYVVVEQGLPNENLYQLLAYCVALGLPSGLLIYASGHALEVQKVRSSGTELEIMGIDMSMPPDALVDQARAAALRLLAHARTSAGANPAAGALISGLP